MKSPGSWRELAPRACKKPLGKPWEALRGPVDSLGGPIGSSCRKLLYKAPIEAPRKLVGAYRKLL
jgi:hypothetical protein